MNSDPDKYSRDRAKARFWTLQIVNFGGAALAFLAVAIVAGKVAGLPEEAGYAVLIVAVLVFFLLPNALRRFWARRDGER